MDSVEWRPIDNRRADCFEGDTVCQQTIMLVTDIGVGTVALARFWFDTFVSRLETSNWFTSSLLLILTSDAMWSSKWKEKIGSLIPMSINKLLVDEKII